MYGSTQPITSLGVRATKFTVGDNGPNTMPAELPPNVGYTYCVEFSVDEAEAAGAKHVNFSQPLPFYVENFLDFPVGGMVPLGYYDADQAAWVPSDNGRIIEILSITGGMADLDVDGSGTSADTQTLADLGITDAEREQLAGLYTVGQSLWRMPVSHFSPGWDANWGWGPPLGALPPLLDLIAWQMDLAKDLTKTCKKGGSIIECQNQILGEAVDITGAPFRLHYHSDRVPGRKCGYSLEIPLSGGSVPPSLKRIDLQIHIAGQRHELSFDPLPDQSYTFTWDGKDAYGRILQGDPPDFYPDRLCV